MPILHFHYPITLLSIIIYIYVPNKSKSVFWMGLKDLIWRWSFNDLMHFTLDRSPVAHFASHTSSNFAHWAFNIFLSAYCTKGFSFLLPFQLYILFYQPHFCLKALKVTISRNQKAILNFTVVTITWYEGKSLNGTLFFGEQWRDFPSVWRDFL